MRVLLFATARETAGGRSEWEWTPPRGERPPSLAELLGALVRSYPALGAILSHSRFAVNGNYASRPYRDVRLGPNDEVAVLPPYSGG